MTRLSIRSMVWRMRKSVTDPLWTERKVKSYKSIAISSRASWTLSLRLTEAHITLFKHSTTTERQAPLAASRWAMTTVETRSLKKVAHRRAFIRTVCTSLTTTRPISDKLERRARRRETLGRTLDRKGTQWCYQVTSQGLITSPYTDNTASMISQGPTMGPPHLRRTTTFSGLSARITSPKLR